MAEAKEEQRGVQVVCVGSFNPAIFQPAWFAGHDLMRQAEADAATIKIIHPDVVSFETETFEINAQRGQFSISSTPKTDALEVIRDLALGTFTILVHTPIKALGINMFGHYRVDSREAYDELGWKLVPPANWSNVLERPGMASVSVQGLRPDDARGSVNATVQPSVVAKPQGVYILANDHYDLEAETELMDATEAVRLLSEAWNGSLERSEAVHEAVLSLI